VRVIPDSVHRHVHRTHYSNVCHTVIRDSASAGLRRMNVIIGNIFGALFWGG